MIYYSKENRRDYTPPLLGNGDIAFNADCEGSVFKDGDRLCFYYCIEDDLYCKNHKGKIKKFLTNVKEKGFDALLAENIKIWNKYHESGYIKTDSVLTDSVYGTAMYTLKCLATRWSVPVSLNNMGWSGKFFAFDEYYSYLALLQSGKTELAERVPNSTR